MNVVRQEICWQNWPKTLPYETANRHQQATNLRLGQVLKAAPIVGFDDRSRLVFFSDCHRGDGSKADAFAPNEDLFLHALGEYDGRGFAYVEVGDGDELWQNRHLDVIQNAHPRAFEMLHKFDQAGRLHMLLGNHDIHQRYQSTLDKDGLHAKEGMVLRHTRTGQRILVTHGHQADMSSDRRAGISRLVVRYIWRRLLLSGVARGTLWQDETRSHPQWEQSLIDNLQKAKFAIERRLLNWVRENRYVLICGHTHRTVSARFGAPPYFNTGSCVVPGLLDGLEIEHGAISQVRWYIANGKIKRTVLAKPQPLHAYQA